MSPLVDFRAVGLTWFSTIFKSSVLQAGFHFHERIVAACTSSCPRATTIEGLQAPRYWCYSLYHSSSSSPLMRKRERPSPMARPRVAFIPVQKSSGLRRCVFEDRVGLLVVWRYADENSCGGLLWS